MLSIPLAAIVWSALSAHADDTDAARYRRWLVAMLLALPYAYAVGSNRNYWSVGAFAGYFWVLAALVLVMSRRPDARQPLVLPFVLGVLLVSSIQLNTAYQRPYRQPQALWAQQHETRLTEEPLAVLAMPESYGLYIEEARKRAATAGFRPGQFALDMTGQSPGLLYALGARSVGQAWFIGGYRGSTRRAAALLALVPCQDLIESWVLFEHHGDRRLSPTLVKAFGAAFPGDYRAVAAWKTPLGAGGSPLVGGVDTAADVDLTRELLGQGPGQRLRLVRRLLAEQLHIDALADATVGALGRTGVAPFGPGCARPALRRAAVPP